MKTQKQNIVKAASVVKATEVKKTEVKKPEVKKPEAKTASVKTTESKKPEIRKVETPKAEPKKVEMPKAETPKVEAKAEPQKVETPKTETKKETQSTKAVVSPNVQVFVNGKRVSAGAQIREMFAEALKGGKIKAEQIAILSDAEKTKETLKIRYAFIKEVTDKKNDRLVNGCPRYGREAVKIGNKNFWLTNDLYTRNIPTFKEWIASL